MPPQRGVAMASDRNGARPQPSHPQQRVALLLVGLLRGIRDEAHRRWLQRLVGTLGAKPSVFGFVEAHFATINESCSEREFWDWKRAFHQKANFRIASKQQLEEQLQIAALWTNRTGKREGPGMFGALKQFYKTQTAFEMMVEHEETHSFRYSHLLRVRIDASGNLDDGWLARNLARINGREDAALLWADFAWLAGRAAGERLSRVWSNILRVIRRCNSSPSRIEHAFMPLSWCRIAASPWAARCSLFASVANLPPGVANSSTSAVPVVLSNVRRACADPSAAAAPAECSDDTNRVQWYGGFFNPQYQLGLSLFAAHHPVGRLHIDCLDGGPTELMMETAVRKALLC